MVVVGWDAADGGEDALELGRQLALRLDRELLQVSVIVTGASPRARSALERNAGRTVVGPSVAQGLSDVATEVAPCPIAIAPRGYAKRRLAEKHVAAAG